MNLRAINSMFYRPRIILVVIIFVGLFLRLYDLGDKSLWMDEFKSLHHARGIVDFRTFLIPTSNAHPPLYFLLLKFWLLLGDSEFHFRLLSVLFGLLVIPATYLLGRQFFEARACLLAALLVAISPFLLLYDREVRMYPMLVFFTIMSMFFFIKSLRENQPEYWAGLTLFASLNVYTHYHAFLVLASMGLFFLVRFETYKSALKQALIANIVIVSLFSLWLPGLFRHLGRFSELVRPEIAFPSVFGSWIAPLYLFFAYSLGQTVLPWNFPIVVPGALLFAFLFFWGTRSLFNSRESLLFFLIFLLFPMLLSLLLKSSSMPRYLIFLGPIFYLICGKGISDIANNRARNSALLLIVGVLAVPLRNYYTNREFHILAQTDPSREVGQYLKENVRSHDLIVNFGGGVGWWGIKYYWGGSDSQFLDVVGYSSTVEEATERLRQLKAAKAERVWVIVAVPALKRLSDESIKSLSKHYDLVLERAFGKDPDYAMKARFFNRNFYEYRITLYLYRSKQHDA